MPARHKARKRALDVLFEADQRSLPIMHVLRVRQESSEQVTGDYTVFLVEGVAEHLAQIDTLIAAHAQEWDISRMPSVDRAVLRMACFELLAPGDVPQAVVINEAVLLAEELSTDRSPAFVNGVLGAIASDPASSIDAVATPADPEKLNLSGP